MRREPGGKDIKMAGTQAFSGLPQERPENPVEFEQIPPAGDMPAPAWLNCEPVSDENAAHSKEHGPDKIACDPSLAEVNEVGLRDFLNGICKSIRQRVVPRPYKWLQAPVATNAWGPRFLLDFVDDEQLVDFVDQFSGGHEIPESGAACSASVGTPDA
jgi:hypothetical protein